MKIETDLTVKWPDLFTGGPASKVYTLEFLADCVHRAFQGTRYKVLLQQGGAVKTPHLQLDADGTVYGSARLKAGAEFLHSLPDAVRADLKALLDPVRLFVGDGADLRVR